jgi:hypothetical protein
LGLKSAIRRVYNFEPCLGVAMDHPCFKHLQGRKQAEFFIRFIARTMDLDDRRRAALEIFLLVDGEPVWS